MAETPQAVVTRWVGNKHRRPSVAVKHGSKGYKIINEEDFDAETMELFVGKLKPHNPNETAEEVKAKATEEGRLAFELEKAQIESGAAQKAAEVAEERLKAIQADAEAKIKIAQSKAAAAAAAQLAAEPEAQDAPPAPPKRGRTGKAK
jgi:hypothetical protein